MKLENKAAKAVRIAGWIVLILGILGGTDMGFIYTKLISGTSDFNFLIFMMCVVSVDNPCFHKQGYLITESRF